jgi:hypothetical protein
MRYGGFPADERVTKREGLLEVVTHLSKHEHIFRKLLEYADDRMKRDFYVG